jgi:LuxR family transcriptional regulator, maltose regulon positive regulatory protein
MPLPILQTKLYVPKHQRQTNVVARPRLLAKLGAAMAGKVTLISAPAGFGKSTLLREWIIESYCEPEEAARGAPAVVRQVSWLTLDADDNELTRFFLYLIASLRKFDEMAGESAWLLLHSPQPPAAKTTLTLLLNDLSSLVDEWDALRSAYVLVLEDYHVITAPAIHEALTYLIDNMPPHLHVVITTRADPPLPFARWRTRDQLAEIRAADLRFTADEAAAFLNHRMGLQLSMEEVTALEQRTEGWIAGLQLVSLSLQGQTDKAGFVQTFSGDNRYVLNYLVEEVLNQQPGAVQEFLLCTSILERLCGPLCDAVTNASGHSQPLLQRLHRANLFLVPLDDEGEWYRFHPLFVDVLRHRLQQAEPGVVADLHTRACSWYEEAGLLADAVHHCLRAANHARTAELLARVRTLSERVRSDKVLALQVHQQASELLADLSPGEAPAAGAVEPLTERELDVLRLLAIGLSNRAIGEQLMISVGTVKSHLKHIYGKLAVESRTQAVAQARAAGLL